MLARIWNQRRRILIHIGIFLVTVGCFFTTQVDITFAQGTPTPVTEVPSWFTSPLGNIYYLLYSFVVTVFGGLMSRLGYVFDYTVVNLILGFGNLYINSNLGHIIDDLWSTIRDLFNLGLIFGVVFIGMKLIFNSDDSGAQKTLGSLILAALLVNFSMFIIKFIIDFSNILASQIYQAFVKLDADATIGTTFLNAISLSASLGDEVAMYNAAQGGFLLIFGLMILFLVTAFVFAAGACLITIRYIALNLYMVFSPILFLGMVFPKMARYSSEYWNGFLGRAFFAPAFIFMLYLSLQVVQKYKEGRTISMDRLFSPEAATAGDTFAFFILAIGFMIASLVVAQKMGAHGASTAISVGHNLRKRGQRMLTQPGRYVARNTVNKLGIAAESGFNRLQNSNPNSRFGRAVASVARNTSMDEFVRNSAAKAKGAKFGMTTTVSDNRKRHGEIQSRYQAAENARSASRDLGTLTSLNGRHAAATELATLSAREAALAPGASLPTVEAARLTQLRAMDPTHTTALTAAEITQRDELQRTENGHRTNLARLSPAEIEQMTDAEQLAIAPYLSHAQAEKLNESKELSPEQKTALVNARVGALQSLIDAGLQDITKMTVEQFELMGADFVNTQAGLGRLTQANIETIRKSKKFGEAQQNRFETVHRAGTVARVQRDVTSGALRTDQISNNDLEAIGVDEIISTGMLAHLSKSQVDTLKKGKISDVQKNALDTQYKTVSSARIMRDITAGTLRYNQLSPAELGTLGVAELVRSGAVAQLTKSQIDDLKKDASVNDTEKRQLDAERTRFINDTVTASNAAGFDVLMRGRKAEEVGELPINVLQHPLGIARLDINVLASMITKNRAPADRDALRTIIEDLATNPIHAAHPLHPHALVLGGFLLSSRGNKF